MMMVSLLALTGWVAATLQDGVGHDLWASDAAFFNDPVCPAVGGLPPEYSVSILEEVRGLLTDNDVSLGVDGDCAPNLFIIISKDPGAAIKELRDRQPTVFNRTSAPDFRALTQGNAPVRSFRSSITKGADGRDLQSGGGSLRLAQASMKGGDELATNRSSRIGKTTRQDVEQSFVYLDAAAIKGLTLRQIGHYGALVGVMPIDVGRVGSVSAPSILTLFADAGDAPQQATDFDNELLTAGR